MSGIALGTLLISLLNRNDIRRITTFSTGLEIWLNRYLNNVPNDYFQTSLCGLIKYFSLVALR